MGTKSILLGITIVCCSILMIKAADEEQAMQMLKTMAQDCKDKEGATDEDVDALLKKEVPTKKEAKCLNACLMDQIGMMNEGKLYPDGVVEVTRMATENNEEMVKAAGEIAEECKGLFDPDRCELSIMLMKCMQEGLTKRGLKAS